MGRTVDSPALDRGRVWQPKADSILAFGEQCARSNIRPQFLNIFSLFIAIVRLYGDIFVTYFAYTRSVSYPPSRFLGLLSFASTAVSSLMFSQRMLS